MSKRNTPYLLELSVPVYAYAKRVLCHFYGENLELENQKIHLLVAAGNLQTHTYRSSAIPAHNNQNLPIEMIKISQVVPRRIHNLLSIYDKDALRFALGSYYNSRAKELIMNTASIFLSMNKGKVKPQVVSALEHYEISPEEIDFQNIYVQLCLKYKQK